jgi:hypothetical protein
MLLKAFSELSEKYLTTDELRRVAKSLAYVCEEVCFKNTPAGEFPCKLPFTHWVLLFTRPHVILDPVDCEKEVCDAEAITRYERILQGRERLEIPIYALDKHTSRGYGIHSDRVDVTLGGFYRREHDALEPLSAGVIDNYRQEAIRKAELHDRAVASNSKRPRIVVVDHNDHSD